MNWISTKLQFNSTEDIKKLFSRYSFSTEGEHTIDGSPVELAPSTPHAMATVVCRDNIDSSDSPRFRYLNLSNELKPVPKLKASESEPDNYEFDLCWPETMIGDLAGDPKPEWLEGVQLVMEEGL